MKEAILAHAGSSDNEVCGLLLAAADGSVRAHPCANVHPTPATHFELDPAALLTAHRAARSGGPQVIGHYHSHPSGRAEPSATDAAQAPPDGTIWLVVAADQLTAWRAVPNGALHDRFDPVELVVT